MPQPGPACGSGALLRAEAGASCRLRSGVTAWGQRLLLELPDSSQRYPRGHPTHPPTPAAGTHGPTLPTSSGARACSTSVAQRPRPGIAPCGALGHGREEGALEGRRNARWGEGRGSSGVCPALSLWALPGASCQDRRTGALQAVTRCSGSSTVFRVPTVIPPVYGAPKTQIWGSWAAPSAGVLE